MNSAERALAELAPDVFADAPVAVFPSSDRGGRIARGQRNDALFRITRGLIARGLDPSVVRVAVRTANDVQCDPPLPERELSSLIDHALSHPDRESFRKAEPDAEWVQGIAESFAALSARLRDRVYPPELIPGLIAAVGIVMMHGQPRSLKTWSMLEIARALATGDAAFGLEQFRIAEPRRVWFLTEEDPEIEIYRRFRNLFAGRNGGVEPETLHVSVQKALTLDDERRQEQIQQYAIDHRIEATIFDPIRSLTAAVDQGPDKLRPLATFLRKYSRTTGSIVLLNHHDTKPPAGKPDDRAKPQRASGGGIFSIADSPIHAELVGASGNRALLTPSHYKFSVAPEPFFVTLEADHPKDPTWVRIQGEPSTAATATEVALHERLCDYLREHPHTSGTKVAQALHVNKAEALEALGELRRKGVADFYQRGQAHLWSVLSTEGQS